MEKVNVLLEKGLRAYRQEQYALAIESYRQAIEQDPNIFDAYFYLAASLVALGREKEAIDAMKRARRVRPGSSATDYNLGLLYKRMGRADDARRHFEEALKKVGSDAALDDRSQMKRNIERELRELR